MYWLIFFNGFDVPEIEASFSTPWGLCKYASVTVTSERLNCYTVLCSTEFKSVSLKNFIDDHKED